MLRRIGQRWLRTLVGLACTLVLVVLGWQGRMPSLFELIELDLYDQRLRQTLTETVDPRIVIVDIDESSLARIGRWPWPRDRVAELIEKLFIDYGVAVVGFDVLFSEPDDRVARASLQRLLQLNGGTLSPAQLAELDGDARLAETLSVLPAVLAMAFDPQDESLAVGETGPALQIDPPLPDTLPIVEAKGVIGSLSKLAQSSTSGFFDNPLVDPDGVFRRVPLIQRYRGEYYPSLALAVWQSLLLSDSVNPVIESDLSGDYQVLTAIDAGGVKIPVDPQGAMLVPYRGHQGSFSYVSAADVIEGSAPQDLMSGAIVLVGTSAAGLLDLRVTPVGPRYPGVEVHANILSALLDQRFFYKPDFLRALNATQMLLVGLILSLALPRLSVLSGTLLTVLFSAGVVAFNFYAFSQLYWVMPLAGVTLLILMLYLFMQTTGFLFESNTRRQLSRTFGQYVPPEVVRSLEQVGTADQLRGESRELTVLFSDVRGFTTLSESLSPTQLTRMMNIYLSEMTAIIHRHRGTIDKYIGDAIMAFWGAPLDDPQHARHALAAALEMLAAMPEVNRQLEAEALPRIRVGMGLNSGEMAVGNMGSNFRMAYTVMGDAVNLGSRLEGLTKYYGVDLLVSEQLYRLCADIPFRELDRVRVKGKHQAIGLYEPLTSADNPWLENFRAGLKAYRRQRWDLAESRFHEVIAMRGEDGPSRIYLQRVGEFKASPPGPDWDAVFTHTEK
ncbi:CHASE2 domain-containing protein [Marinobacterium ramblicola]|uniref:CHASE2 domain-containing protein n=1 Tax=Marinobacterium ramblicola TaxID=2849041 RepID=UPI001FE45443|nr:adenylate/guanylate cyclase domain-containing protein [Marinobacterium ramblicola]